MQTLTLTPNEAFERYQVIRSRLPMLPEFDSGLGRMKTANHLGDLVSFYDVFVFDAFGVLNVGDVAIAGARDRIDALQRAGKRLFVLTNAASYSFPSVVVKFQKLGFAFGQDELISSRDVCETQMLDMDPAMTWGVIAPSNFNPTEVNFQCSVLRDDQSQYDNVDGFIFLSTECWQNARQSLLISSLQRRSRPVIVANPDLVAPREVGLTLEPGFYAHDLLDHLPDLDLTFHGKPFASVYDRVEQLIGDKLNRERIAMMGDSLHTDIWGASVRGWGSVLVTDHGFLKGQNVEQAIQDSGTRPNWIVPSI
ncbi:HAD-IIA family hydrolase [Cohaesibacter celericrescens]|uniref:HAD-IIA family hydrolase n=1 Tax=Cohaesibacter celericrescens TaxID=2067669 RepID=UPI0035648676